MYGDFSKWPFDSANVVGPLQQQGRVLLDTQQNAATTAIRRWQDEAARTTFGRYVAAVPAWQRNAFQIESAQMTNQVFVTVDPGQIWADGILVQLAADAATQPPTATRVATYLAPPFGTVPTNPGPGAAGTRDAVVLEVWREALSGFQDTLLLEPALGGPDSYELLRTQFAFRLFRLGQNDTCETILGQIQDDFGARGHLTATLAPTTVTPGDCPTVEGGGYSGFEHNLYRIEIAELTAGPAMFKWSQFNGGLVGTGLFDAATSTLTIVGNKSAIATSGLTDCYLECFELDPQWGYWRLSYAAPATCNEDTISLAPAATFGGIPGGTEPRFFRLWNGLRKLSDFPLNPVAPTELRDGIRLQFDAADATPNYLPYDYWTFAVRAGDIGNPQTLVDASPPEGVHRHRVPLAELHWTGGGPIAAPTAIEDCRQPVHPLTGNDCCCTYTVGDGGDFATIQGAIDALPANGGRVCILPGDYVESVSIDGKRDIIVTGCRFQTRVTGTIPASKKSSIADPAFSVTNSTDITIRDMVVIAGSSGIGVLLEQVLATPTKSKVSAGPLDRILLESLEVHAATASAIEQRGGAHVTIRGCNVLMDDVLSLWAAVTLRGQDGLVERNSIKVVSTNPVVSTKPVASTTPEAHGNPGGLWLRGGCLRMRVIDNLIDGGIAHGIILGNVQQGQVGGAAGGATITAGDDTGWVLSGNDDCAGCVPGSSGIPPNGEGKPPWVAGELLEEISDRAESDLPDGPRRNRRVRLLHRHQGPGGHQRRRPDHHRQHHPRMLAAVAGARSRQHARAHGLRRHRAGRRRAPHGQRQHPREQRPGPSAPGLRRLCAPRDRGGDLAQSHLQQRRPHPGRREAGRARRARRDLSADGRVARRVSVANLCLPGRRAPPVTGRVPAARIHDNVIDAPLGQAIFVAAIGPVSIVGNSLTSRGVGPDPLQFLAATVLVVDSGAAFDNPVFNAFTIAPKVSMVNSNPTSNSKGGQPPLGHVLVSNNQLLLVANTLGVRAIASIALLSNDDVGFHANQSLSDRVSLTTHLLAVASTVRVTDNRLQEGRGDTQTSAYVWGGLNLTAQNQTTHRLHPLGINVVTSSNQNWF